MAEQNQMDRGPAIPRRVEDKAGQGVKHAGKATADVSSAAGTTVEEYQGRAQKVWNDAGHRVRSFHDKSEQYIRENPTKAVFTALGVGFLLGTIFRR